MSELVQMFGIMAIVTSAFVALLVRSGLKEIKESRAELNEAWSSYFRETQSYKPAKKYRVKYVDGSSEVVNGTSYTIQDAGLTINDEFRKTVLYVSAKSFKAVHVERETFKVEGPSTKEGR